MYELLKITLTVIITLITIYYIIKCNKTLENYEDIKTVYSRQRNDETTYEDNKSVSSKELCDVMTVNNNLGCNRDAVEEYSDKFFKFRDSTANISQIAMNDPVDIINQIRENPDDKQFEGMRIRDIYDAITTQKY